jgi:hypothetical protein
LKDILKKERVAAMKFDLETASALQAQLPMQAQGVPLLDLEKLLMRWEKSMQVIFKEISAEFKSWTEDTPLELRKTHVETLIQKHSQAVAAFIKVVSAPLTKFQKQILLLGASDEYLRDFVGVLKRVCILGKEKHESAMTAHPHMEVCERVCICVSL